jgi:hypothetical protein
VLRLVVLACQTALLVQQFLVAVVAVEVLKAERQQQQQVVVTVAQHLVLVAHQEQKTQVAVAVVPY